MTTNALDLTQNTSYTDYEKKARYWHYATLFFYCALLALFTLHQWFRDEGISLFQWSVQCIPLLIFWFGLRVRKRRTYLWMCFVLLLYFIKGVEGAMGFSPSVFDFLLLFFSTALFTTNTLAARYLMLIEKLKFAAANLQASATSDIDEHSSTERK